MFSKLTNRYCLTGNLKVMSALHVGAGTGEGDVDMAIVRDRNRNPFIPGSSLRGVMRSLVERMLATVAPARSCILFDDTHKFCPTSNRDAQKAILKMMEDGDDNGALEILLGEKARRGRLCDTCRLFGSQFTASKLKISDLPLGAKEGSVRHGVGIDRDTGTAREKIKFEYEVLEQETNGMAFRLEFVGENLGRVAPKAGCPSGDPDFALLGLALKQMERHVRIGGKTGSGLGRSKLELTKVRYFDECEAHRLVNFLKDEGEEGYATKKPDEFREMLTGELNAYLDGRAGHA